MNAAPAPADEASCRPHPHAFPPLDHVAGERAAANSKTWPPFPVSGTASDQRSGSHVLGRDPAPGRSCGGIGLMCAFGNAFCWSWASNSLIMLP